MAREDTKGGGGGLTYAVMKFMVGSNLERAHKRMRWAWVAGLIWAGMELFNALTLYFGVEASDRPGWSLGQFIFVLVEAGVLGTLAYGLKHDSRAAAVGLFLLFVVSRPLLISMGMINVVGLENFGRLLVQLIFAYLFFQGVRGAMTFHYLTHSGYPPKYSTDAPEPEASLAGTDSTSGTTPDAISTEERE